MPTGMTWTCDMDRCDNVVTTKHGVCDECKAPQKPHACPFKQDVYDDHKTLCTCSREAEHECAMDI